VINIASIDGIRLNPQDTFSYHASKAGLIYLTRRMAATLIADAIIVSRHRARRLRLRHEPRGPRPGRRDRQTHPVPPHRPRRGHGRAAAIYLASRAGDYVVGETIAVDGGVALASFGGL
jgi:NAD(P)-dependent dehydrogenase (short-subunit alcohol dehydrogenase family)